MGDVAKGTGGNVSDAAGRVSSLVKNRWEVLQKSKSQQSRSSSGDSVQERFISAAASTGTVLKRSFTETKDRVIVGKMKVEEVISQMKWDIIIHYKSTKLQPQYLNIYN